MFFFNQGFPIGRYFGTLVSVSVGHVIMLLYMASGAEKLGPAAMVAFGLVYFLSILLHEWGHVIACRAVKGRADHIILGTAGGLAQVEPPNRPLPHFITTAGGPAVNALLWATFWGLQRVPAVQHIIYDRSSFGMVAWVFFHGMVIINKLLLVLNLLPIFPMDGGRLLWHALWPVIGYRNATEFTGMVGIVGGIALIILGTGAWPINIPFVEVTFGDNGNDYWLLIIGISCIMSSLSLYNYARSLPNDRKN